VTSFSREKKKQKELTLEILKKHDIEKKLNKKRTCTHNRFFFASPSRKKKKEDGYLTMTVPAAPVRASTALSSEVMMALRPALLLANMTAA